MEIWKSRNLEIWGPGNLGIWRSGDLEIQKIGVQKIKKIKILKIEIRSAKNVGKVWIGRKKSSWPYLGPSEAVFHGPEKSKNVAYFYLLGPLLLSTRGGGIGSYIAYSKR